MDLSPILNRGYTVVTVVCITYCLLLASPLHSVVIHTYSFKVLKSLHYKQCSKLFLIISQVSYYNCSSLGNENGALDYLVE